MRENAIRAPLIHLPGLMQTISVLERRKKEESARQHGCEYNNRNTQLVRILSFKPENTFISQRTKDMIRLICALVTMGQARPGLGKRNRKDP